MDSNILPSHFEHTPGTSTGLDSPAVPNMGVLPPSDMYTEVLPGTPPTLTETRDALRQVYGDNGLAWYDHYAKQERGLSTGQLVHRFRNQPCSDQTAFYRHYGALQNFPKYTAADVATDGHLVITDIGSSGEEVWSFAAELERSIRWGKGHDDPGEPTLRSFHINAYSVNQTVLDRAHGPYRDSRFGYGSIEHNVGKVLMEECFEETLHGLVPRPEFASHATFARHDILTAPVSDPPANAVAIFNVLWHYPREARNHIMAHVLQGLRPNGVFMFEGDTRDSRQAPGYREWVEGLYDYGICKRTRMDDTVQVYRPDRARKIFVPSKNITSALGVLAAA